MTVVHRRFSVETKGYCDIVDISEKVSAAVEGSQVKSGTVLVFVPGSTAGITTIEFEPGVVGDLKEAVERMAPMSLSYAHDARWGDGNGFSHVRAALLGASFTCPVIEGAPALGTWQQIVLIDFDNRPRRREVALVIQGEKRA